MCAALMAMSAVVGAANASAVANVTVPVPPANNPFAAPLERGDTTALAELERRYGAGPITRAMIRAQLHYSVAKLFAEAQRCQHAARANGSTNGLGTALYCSEIARHAALVQGNVLAFLREMEWVKDVLYPAIERTREPTHRTVHLVFGTGMDSANLKKLIDEASPATEEWIAQRATLPIHPDASELTDVSAPPAIDILINGKPEKSFVVMIAHAPRTPVAIVEPRAVVARLVKKLGLRLVVRDYFEGITHLGAMSVHVAASLYVANAVTVGPLVLRHLAVGVTASNVLRPGIYLNKAMWRRFGEVAISDHAVRLSRAVSRNCTPVVPMTFAGGSGLVGRFLFPVTVDGEAATAVVALRGGGATEISEALVAATRGSSDDARRPAGRNQGAVIVGVGAQSFDVRRVYVDEDLHLPTQVVVGKSILHGNVIHLEVGGDRPSICVNHRRNNRNMDTP